MNATPLVFGFRKYFVYVLQHTKILVSDYQLDPVYATTTQPLEESDQTGLIFLHVLGSAKNLEVSVIDCNCHKNSHIFKLYTSVTVQINPIYIDIRIASALQMAVLSIFDVDIRFLVQLTDGGGRDFAAPIDFSNILHILDEYAY